MIEKTLIEKENKLKELLASYQSLVVAFSSGVDSTYLLKIAKDTLGENVIAVTATANWFPQRESSEAKDFCAKHDISHIMIEATESEIEGFRQNPKNRCYLCKRALFKKIQNEALKHQISYVAEASNMDDNGDYRPGMIAIKELGIMSPLREVGLTKEEIRFLSKKHDLPTWDKPSFACLASRFVYGQEITSEKLKKVELAEQHLFALGFKQLRVRIHENLARIEVLPDDIETVIANRESIDQVLKQYGFDYVTLDLLGFRTGSMNETLTKEEQNAYKEDLK